MKRWLILILLGSFAATAEAQEKVIIDISNATARKVSVAVPPLLTGTGGDPKEAARSAELLRKDLDFSGVFRTVDTAAWERQAQGDSFEAPQYKLWKMTGADSLVRGRLSRQGKGWLLELGYFDPIQEKMILGKQYQVAGDVAPAVHAFANELMEFITGRKGPFNSRIAFEYRKPETNRKDLWVMDLDGSDLQPVTRNNMLNLAPSWSPDGKLLAYTSYKRRNPDLFLMDVVNGSDEAISTRNGSNTGAAFSHDGQYVAATLSFEGNSEIYLLNRKGDVVQRVTRNGAIDVQPTFSPDGTKIAFTSDRLGNPQIFVANVDGTDVRRVTLEGRYNSSPAWSPTGEWIAYFNRDDNHIWLVRPDGSERKRLTASAGSHEDPSWSPDGRYVVFSSNRRGNFDLWAIDSITGTETQVTSLPGDERNPAWGRYFNR